MKRVRTEKEKAARRKWCAEHKEHMRAYGRQYRVLNKEKVTKLQREYQARNKEKLREYNRLYHIKRKARGEAGKRKADMAIVHELCANAVLHVGIKYVNRVKRVHEAKPDYSAPGAWCLSCKVLYTRHISMVCPECRK